MGYIQNDLKYQNNGNGFAIFAVVLKIYHIVSTHFIFNN